MLKAADVQLTAHETVGAGLCNGNYPRFSDKCRCTIEAGMHEGANWGVERGDGGSSTLNDLQQTLPIASCWIEQPKPLRLPIAVRSRKELVELELVELPKFEQPARSESNSPRPHTRTSYASL